MAKMWRGDDEYYSSLEDENPDNVEHTPERIPAMVIDAALARLRARAGCQEDSFVRQLSASMLSRIARNIFRKWESAISAMEDGEGTCMPDLIVLVTEELRRFGQCRAISNEYNRRSSIGSLAHDEIVEQRRRERGDVRRSHSRSMDDPALDLDMQPVRFRSSPDSPMSPSKGLADPEELRRFERTEHVRVRRSSYSRQHDDPEREERRRLRRSKRSVEELESSLSPRTSECSLSPRTSESGSDFQKSGEHELVEARKEVSEVSPLAGAVGGVSPEESNTPSAKLQTSVEENVTSAEAVPETGTKVKRTPKNNERLDKRTRKIVERLSNRQLASLHHRNISRMDAMEMIIQLSESMKRLKRLINRKVRRESADVYEATLAQFFDGLEITRRQEITIRAAAKPAESPLISIPTSTEKPRRDPRVDDV